MDLSLITPQTGATARKQLDLVSIPVGDIGPDSDYDHDATGGSQAAPRPPERPPCGLSLETPREVAQTKAEAEPLQALTIPVEKGVSVESTLRRFKDFVNGGVFLGISSSMIVANTIYIGLESNVKMDNEFKRLRDETQEDFSSVPETFFMIFFILELLVRIAGLRLDFIIGQECWWNLFDFFLITFSVVEKAVATSAGNLSVLRIFRIFRMVRLLKVIQRNEMLVSLNTMIIGIISCLVPLMWASLILLIVMYAFAIFFMSVVSAWLSERMPGDDYYIIAALSSKWSSVYKVICILFEAVTGGNDWSYLCAEVKDIGEAYYVIFSLYILFITLGVWNIVTGFFVDGTIQATSDQRSELLREAAEKKHSTLMLLGQMFHMLDADQSGTLSLDELEAAVTDADINEYFLLLEVAPEDARILFEMLDLSGTGEIEINDFMNGCLRITGGPRSLDICACLSHIRRVEGLCHNVLDLLQERAKGTNFAQ
eukprot:NODE_4545_length_1878_cov_18.447173.p1 GENE.NODE_4545_length_1878_cov_18.447173~~NODE_4545_length_1878_cov_18.447173.p1  ORF type:complete len:529 (+),score=110.86 NODE_4545_length_1878_cov_18.447173:134-1588(+)